MSKDSLEQFQMQSAAEEVDTPSISDGESTTVATASPVETQDAEQTPTDTTTVKKTRKPSTKSKKTNTIKKDASANNETQSTPSPKPANRTRKTTRATSNQPATITPDTTPSNEPSTDVDSQTPDTTTTAVAEIIPPQDQAISNTERTSTTEEGAISEDILAITENTLASAAENHIDLPVEETILTDVIAEPIGDNATIDIVVAEASSEESIASETTAPEETILINIIAEPIGDNATIDIVVAEASSEESIASEPAIPADKTTTETTQHSKDRRELVRSAALVGIGNLGSSILGMLRQSFIASTGAAISGPFFIALSPAQKFNDFVVNGSVPGALIPTFNDYAAPEKKEELRRLVFTLVNLVFLIMGVAAIAFLFVAPWFITHLLAPTLKPEEQLLAIRFAQIIFFSLLILGPFAVLQAALFARKEFGWPAFATASYHVGIIVGALLTSLLAAHFAGAKYGIAFGVILGAIGEVGLLVPGLRNQGISYMFVLDLKHPAIKRILKLYAPIAFSFFVSACFAFLDQSLATQTACLPVMRQAGTCGDANLTAMQLAATLIQFPGGLVASALSFAVLPTLTAYIRENETERFKSTLLMGFRLGLLLMIPAAAGLIVLQLPIVAMLFQHGNFKPAQSSITALALQYEAFQLPFIAIDQLLISAFYARKNTIIPVTVGVISFLGYLAVALPFWHTLGMPALAIANTVQNSLHAIILLIWLRAVIGPMHLGKLLPTIGKLLLAAACMVAVAWGLQALLDTIPFFVHFSLIARILIVVSVGTVAAVVYFGLVILFKVEEVTMLKGAFLAKLSGKK